MVIVIAATKGLVQAMDTTRLVECSRPAALSAALSAAWEKSILDRLNFANRRCPTKSGTAPDDLEEVNP